MITQRIIDYPLRGRCCELSNGIVDIAIMIDKGPRIIRYGFVGEVNELCDNAPLTVDVEGYDEPWYIFGGHRLWPSPEKYPKTYYPDNDPVDYEWIENGVRVTKPAHPNVHIESVIEITLEEGSVKANILHTLINRGEWPIKTACWCPTNMKPGGLMVLPFSIAPSSFYDGAKGIRKLVLWPYCSMDDHRIKWGNHYVIVKHEEGNTVQTKFAIENKDGWSAYFNHDNLFIKRFEYTPDAEYPEGGGNSVTFMIEFMHEIESLSPMKVIAPDESMQHTETWELHKGVKNPDSFDEAVVADVIEKYR